MAQRARRLRAPGAHAAPIPRQQIRKALPPCQSFALKGRVFFIIGTHQNETESHSEARKGIWGHYIVPYYIDSQERARPYLRTEQNTRDNISIYWGDPGFPIGGRRGEDHQAIPNMNYCKRGVDFVSANNQSQYWEVGLAKLKESLEKAEKMDLAFAQRMEGLGNVARPAVWGCLDPDFDPTDRKALMDQFMGKYLDRFWSQVDTGNHPDIKNVSEEAIHKHRAWCKAWAKKHFKGLTPAVTAPAEALAGEFYQYLQSSFHPEFKLTHMELARVFMRHPEIAPDFASCLYYYATNLEQTRGGRNASYKQMTVIATSKATSYAKLGNMLAEKGHVLRETFASMSSEHEFYLHPYIIDWYDVLGQMPYVHRYFEEPMDTWGGWGGARASASDGNAPPWKIGRTSK